MVLGPFAETKEGRRPVRDPARVTEASIPDPPHGATDSIPVEFERETGDS